MLEFGPFLYMRPLPETGLAHLCDDVEQAVEFGVMWAMHIVAQLMQHSTHNKVVIDESLAIPFAKPQLDLLAGTAPAPNVEALLYTCRVRAT